ncbi:S-layer homology domain-containing protein [Marinitoga hydrogenitolerans DSM 16785]|uniref:S-layer homology domain-containing protein n=1 Tax=Marinitoga hydrogenitolerans (strain DSM 16785 / JCM 12826 / AT1271) TaxID=1122195 RepID=A0A1M4S689_MARH1|nr:S-layer homology domain-containing protein [Marinitoga hydrogenitolerans]SHE27726.1 S-layer homology domain-containing protein [Marinitoga hydrogenitolerans DSM 16785]
MRKTLLVLALVLFGVLSFAFKDVPEDHWAYEYVMDLANRGILPMEDNFNPDIVLTKAEVAVLLSDTLTYVENDPVLAKAEDIKRVETVLKMLDKKLAGLSSLSDDVAVNIENIDGLWEELDTVKSDLDYVAGQNVKEHQELKDMISKKADMDTVDKLSKDLEKTNAKLETITKVAYRAFNNADMLVEDMLDLQDQVDELSGNFDTFKTYTARSLMELKYKTLDLEDRLSNDEDKLAKLEGINTKLNAIESAVTANQTVLISLTKKSKDLEDKLGMTSSDLSKVQYLSKDLSDRMVNVEGKVAANEESSNKANMLAMVGIALAGVALVLPFVVK